MSLNYAPGTRPHCTQPRRRLRAAIVRDLSTSLHADAARFSIVSVKPGSIIVTVTVRPDPQARDPRSAQQLAAQMTALANDPSSVREGGREGAAAGGADDGARESPGVAERERKRKRRREKDREKGS